MFGTSSDYSQLNAGAHRKRSNNFDAPAAIWHVAFWITTPTSSDYDRHHERTKQIIDDFLIEICRIAKFSPAFTRFLPWPRTSTKLILFSTIADITSFEPIARGSAASQILTPRENAVFMGDNRVCTIKFYWFGLGITIRCEMHTEYFTLTTFAENISTSDISQVDKNYRPLKDYFDGSPADIGALRHYWFRTFWNDYSSAIFSRPVISKIYGSDTFRTVYADFRGLVLSDVIVSFLDPPYFIDIKKPTWGQTAQSLFLPIIAPDGLDECTSSYMLGGRALYTTALAPQQSTDGEEDRTPLEYILYAHQKDPHDGSRTIVNRWQLGRLAERIHFLGTVRLASLKELSALRSAGQALAGLDKLVVKARDEIESDPANAIEQIKHAHVYFNKITYDFNIQTSTDSGLLYRIERSRYYLNQFSSTIKYLTIDRVGGFQNMMSSSSDV